MVIKMLRSEGQNIETPGLRITCYHLDRQVVVGQVETFLFF